MERKQDKSLSDMFQDFPVLSYWYGLSIAELLAAPRWLLELYAQALPALQAQELSLKVAAAIAPWMKPAQRRALMRRAERLQTIFSGDGARQPKSKQQIAFELASMGISYQPEGES